MEHVFQLYKRMWPGIELSKKLHDVRYAAHVLYSFSLYRNVSVGLRLKYLPYSSMVK